jgi:hypothetical protein
MSVTASTPVNTAQLTAQLTGTTGVPGTLAVQGDPTADGAILWSSQWSDEQISNALTSVTYQAPAPTAQETAVGQVAELAASIPGHITQATTDAATIGALTAGAALTADQVTALQNQANGWITMLEGLSALVTATGVVPPAD